ncbi:MAG TPA: hypothetical protein VMV24_00155 [Candidatus Dormibacteraeota bacterium]|nr:hypothetical protein [Candidatus Dormibacteraeota bacterium]
MLKKSFKVIWLIILLTTIYLLWLNRWWFYDEYRLYGYSPPPAIASIASQDQLTNYSKTLLYVYHPALEDSVYFNNHCKVTPAAIVLGCTVIGNGIYLYNIQDPTLNGVEQVTAAYEMLHVAYSRLSSSQLKTVNQLVMSTYDKLSVNNSFLRTQYQSYLKTEGPGAVVNEMHSTLGTEVSNLPPALENYYKKYFKNRQVIINFENQYQSVFLARENAIANDDQQLSSIKSQIDSLFTTMSSEMTNIKNQQSNLASLKYNGKYIEYNNQVTPYNSLINLYNGQIATYQELINQYNTLVGQRNQIAISENILSNEINSLSATAPAN